jgi:hypothetical protein
MIIFKLGIALLTFLYRRIIRMDLYKSDTLWSLPAGQGGSMAQRFSVRHYLSTSAGRRIVAYIIPTFLTANINALLIYLTTNSLLSTKSEKIQYTNEFNVTVGVPKYILFVVLPTLVVSLLLYTANIIWMLRNIKTPLWGASEEARLRRRYPQMKVLNLKLSGGMGIVIAVLGVTAISTLVYYATR